MHTLLKYFSLFSLVWDVQIRRLQNHYGVVFSVLQQKETLNGSKQKFHPYFLFHSWERNIYFLTKIKNEERFLSKISSARNLRCFVFILERSIFCFNYYFFSHWLKNSKRHRKTIRTNIAYNLNYLNIHLKNIIAMNKYTMHFSICFHWIIGNISLG